MSIPQIIHSYNQNNHVLRYHNGDEKITIFQSYKTIMFVMHDGYFLLNDNESNYTNTTCKYLYKFIDDFIVYDNDYPESIRRELAEALRSGNKKKALLEYYKNEMDITKYAIG